MQRLTSAHGIGPMGRMRRIGPMGRIGLIGSGILCVRSLPPVQLSQPGASHTFAEPALLNKIPLEPADLPVQKEVAVVAQQFLKAGPRNSKQLDLHLFGGSANFATFHDALFPRSA